MSRKNVIIESIAECFVFQRNCAEKHLLFISVVWHGQDKTLFEKFESMKKVGAGF